MAEKEELGEWVGPGQPRVQGKETGAEEQEKDEARKREQLQIEYLHLLKDYDDEFSRLKKMQRRFPGAETDPEVRAAMSVIDDERHQTHLKLLAVGEKFGKNKQDVWVDILREQGTLEEYGLPEFIIMKASDFLGKDKWDIKFDLEKMRPMRASPITTEEAGGASWRVR